MSAQELDLIFDADCVLCSSVVHFILARERAPTLRFVNAWSKTGLAIAAKHGLTRSDLDQTFLLVRGATAYVKSDAALEVARELRAPWSWLARLKLVPRSLRDPLYSLLARRRYRWFGRRQQCFRPLPAHAHRFIDDQPAEISR